MSIISCLYDCLVCTNGESLQDEATGESALYSHDPDARDAGYSASAVRPGSGATSCTPVAGFIGRMQFEVGLTLQQRGTASRLHTGAP